MWPTPALQPGSICWLVDFLRFERMSGETTGLIGGEDLKCEWKTCSIHVQEWLPLRLKLLPTRPEERSLAGDIVD